MYGGQLKGLNVLSFATVLNRVQNSAQEKGLHECADPAGLRNPKFIDRDVNR